MVKRIFVSVTHSRAAYQEKLSIPRKRTSGTFGVAVFQDKKVKNFFLITYNNLT